MEGVGGGGVGEVSDLGSVGGGDADAQVDGLGAQAKRDAANQEQGQPPGDAAIRPCLLR
jgi:hypothetical protein